MQCLLILSLLYIFAVCVFGCMNGRRKIKSSDHRNGITCDISPQHIVALKNVYSFFSFPSFIVLAPELQIIIHLKRVGEGDVAPWHLKHNTEPTANRERAYKGRLLITCKYKGIYLRTERISNVIVNRQILQSPSLRPESRNNTYNTM